MSSLLFAPLACPHCAGKCVQRYGSFPLNDGTRRRRFRCRGCGRTFHLHTGTLLHYLKKRDRWALFLRAVAQQLTLRQSAAFLDVHLTTAFRWRHRLLGALCSQAQPVLTGSVVTTAAYIPYSEKGSRTTNGTGAHGTGRRRRNWSEPAARASGKPLFRRFKDGKPSCVLLAGAGEQRVIAILSRGRPGPQQLQTGLAQLLGEGTELWAHDGMLSYAAASQRLGVCFRDMREATAEGAITPLYREVDRLRAQLYGWLGRFHGVATRYLERYLAWYRLVGGPARANPQVVIPRLMLLISTQRSPGQVA